MTHEWGNPWYSLQNGYNILHILGDHMWKRGELWKICTRVLHSPRFHLCLNYAKHYTCSAGYPMVQSILLENMQNWYISPKIHFIQCWLQKFMATNLPKITSVCYNPLARLQNPLTQFTRKNFLCMPLLKDILCLVHVRERLLRCFKITNVELQNQNSYRSKNKLLKTNPILDTISAHCHCS